MKEILEHLFHHQYLNASEASSILGEISDGKFNSNEISAFLTVFRMRNITVDELTGFRNCLRERCVPIDLSDFDPIDLCGTGGDGKDTFNISTLASFVVAGAGYKVAKHGNYGVSSSCGSSNVMEFLGYEFTNDADRLKRQIEEAGICFLHAPLFHPAMKEVAPIRRDIGIQTFFNMLGPMVNPSAPRKQLVGVFALQLQRYYKYIYEQEHGTAYRIVHSLDGYDEVSLTGSAKVVAPQEEYLLHPTDLIENKLDPEAIKGGRGVADSADIFLNILQGDGTEAQNSAVMANTALAIQCYEPQKSIRDCFAQAGESLKSGKAFQSFKKLLTL